MNPMNIAFFHLLMGTALSSVRAHETGSCAAIQADAVASAEHEVARYGTPEAKLRLAALNGDLDEVAFVLRSSPSSGMSMTEAKKQALAGAAWSGRAQAVRILLEAGTEPDAVTPMSGSPAIVLAAECGQIDAMKVLKEHGADVFAGSEPERRDNVLHGALEAALASRQFPTAHWLLDHGYDVCRSHEIDRIFSLVARLEAISAVPAELKDRLACRTPEN